MVLAVDRLLDKWLGEADAVDLNAVLQVDELVAAIRPIVDSVPRHCDSVCNENLVDLRRPVRAEPVAALGAASPPVWASAHLAPVQEHLLHLNIVQAVHWPERHVRLRTQRAQHAWQTDRPSRAPGRAFALASGKPAA